MNLETIIDSALAQSIWAALSIALIFYILKKQENRDLKQDSREAKYQEIISDLSTQLLTVEELKNDVKEIKSIIKKCSS